MNWFSKKGCIFEGTYEKNAIKGEGVFTEWLLDCFNLDSPTGDCADFRVKGPYKYKGGIGFDDILQDNNAQIAWEYRLYSWYNIIIILGVEKLILAKLQKAD